ncbi:MAG: hypothetical protein AB1916_13685 [Thermodesulfobacteriota bacterium]
MRRNLVALLVALALAALPGDAKRTPVPCQRPDGTTVPPDTRVIWPFACAPR